MLHSLVLELVSVVLVIMLAFGSRKLVFTDEILTAQLTQSSLVQASELNQVALEFHADVFALVLHQV